MCKKIIKKGNIVNLKVDRSINYIYEEVASDGEISPSDIFILSSDNLFALASDIMRIRSLNPLSRTVVSTASFQENLIQSLFPWVEFISNCNVLLSDIYSGRATYSYTTHHKELNKKERRILHPLSYGMSDKEVALYLGVSQRTVVRTKQRVIEKSGLVSASQLAVFSALKCWVYSEEKKTRERKHEEVKSGYERKRENNI